MSDTDLQLLARYTRHHAEEAFAELVRRHVDLVHSAALRQVRSPQLAEEVAQSVFLDLAHQTKHLAPDTILTAWLYEVTRRTAIDVVRREARRQLREQIATEMNTMNATADDWTHIEPLLDEAMHALDATDRAAVLLRYFENKSLREVGAALGTSGDAAQKRVSRAVERLRAFFAKRGLTVGASGLAVVLSANAVQAAPAGLLTRISKSIPILLPTGKCETVPSVRLGPQSSILQNAALVALVSCVAVLILRHVTEEVDLANAQGNVSAESKSNDGPMVASSYRSPRQYGYVKLSGRTEVPRAIRQRFTVLDSVSGNPLANVHIRAAYFYAGGRGEGHSVYTDAEGIAGIPEPNENGTTPGMNVFVIKEGYVPKAIGFGLNAATEYVMKLDPAVLARGVVVDEDGTPVAGARIEAIRAEDYEKGKPNTDFQLTRVETDSEGRWSYHHIPQSYSDANFKLTCDGYAVTQVSVGMTVPESQNARFVIKRGHVVYGQVVDADGSLIFGAAVSEVHNFGHRQLRADTDANGEFLMAGLSVDEERKALLRVDVFGKASHLQAVQLHARTNFVRIVLGQGKVFRGQVMDEGGRPVSGVVVQTDFDFERQIQKRFEWRTETEADGRFEWTSAPEEPVCYWIEANGYEVIRGLRKPADGTLHQITLKARR